MKYTYLIVSLLLSFSPLHALWYAGDLYLYGANQPREQMAKGFQEALDTHLDWRIFYNAPQTGAFVGLPAFVAEENYNNPHQMVPLLGSTWQKGIAFVGVDARAPIPQVSFENLETWATAHNGLIIFNDASHPRLLDHNHPVAFQGINKQGWHPICEPGAQWDSLLTANHRLTLLGGSSIGNPVHPVSQTYIFAESRDPQDLLSGLRKGATFVAESDGIYVDFRVNDYGPGNLLATDDDLIIHIRANANHPISNAYLVANSEIIWQHQPNKTRWNTQIRMPQNGYGYIRLVLESQTGGYRTLTNPVYLSDTLNASLEPTPDLARPQTIHLAIDSALESIAQLSEEAQASILSEYLQAHQTRYATALVLEHREDLIGDYVLETLLDHHDVQIRLGAIFALLVRNSPDLLPHLFEGLDDPAPQMQNYVARAIYQFAPTRNETRLRQAIYTHTGAQHNLIRALNPSIYDAQLISHLIHLAGTAPQPTASAAIATLTEFGNRSFRTITTLRDSAHQDHVPAVEILGLIADPRLSDDLLQLHLSSPGGSMRRASFHALQKLNAPYPNRPEILCPRQETTPNLDANLDLAEWKNTSIVQHLVHDADGSTGFESFELRIGRNATQLLLAVTSDIPPHLLSHAQIDLNISPSPDLDVPFIFSITHPQAQTQTPIDPLLHLAQHVKDQTWTIEGAITLSDLGVDPDHAIPYLRFNVSLQTQNNRWSWTPTYGSPENPEHFGNLYINRVTQP